MIIMIDQKSSYGSIMGRIKQLVLPLCFASILGALFYYGGPAYHLIGAAALDTTQKIFGYILGVGVLICLTIFTQRLVQFVLLEGLVASALGTPVPRLLSQLSALIIYLVGFAAIFGIVFKQDLTALWAASGIAGFVFGMALREIILDIFTGLAINIDRPLRIGDEVLLHRVGDMTIEGRVIEISWRTTRIVDLNGSVVVLSNSKLASSTITNYSQPNPSVWAMVRVTLDITIPPERVERVLLGAVAQAVAEIMPGVAADTMVRTHDITAYGVEYVVALPTSLQRRHAVRSILLKMILTHLSQAGLRPSTREPTSSSLGTGVSDTAPGAEHRAALLGRTPLFSGFDSGALALLATGARLRTVVSGDALAQGGEVATAMFLVLEGLVEAEPLRREARAALADGRVPLSSWFGPGHLIGGEATLIGDGYPRTVRARTPVLIAELDHTLLRRLLTAHPATATHLAHQIAEALGQEDAAGTKGRQWGAASEADRVADVLGSLCRTFADVRLAPIVSAPLSARIQ
jgi:small-conductance mechanosensitive channel/CRP-like cAMP-binding protein